MINLLLKFPLLKNISVNSVHKLVWYAIIGAITFVITNMCLYVFRRLLVWADVPSIAFSYIFAVVCHFLLHNIVTFKDSTEPFKRRLGGHLTVSVFNYFIGVGVATAVIKYVIDNNITPQEYKANDNH
jgi:putative flippase GtrA